jgi:type I restriction enzyme M protein
MASPLTVARNDYHKNEKNSTVYTPVGVSQFLFDILKPIWSATNKNWGRNYKVFDPAIGTGRLTEPWMRAGCKIIGCDPNQTECPQSHAFFQLKFENFAWPEQWSKPDLVLVNPPFNGAAGRQLYPAVFLERIFKLFGPMQPTVLFAPMGFRLNQRCKSKRWRWLRDCDAQITSIVSLPLDIFPGVEFHSEVLIFNVAGLKSHYFLPETAL